MDERTGKVVSREIGLALLFAVAALPGISCGGGDVTTPATTGSLTITTRTSGSEPDADGYAVIIDDGAETAIAPSGTFQRDEVEPGDHSVRLTGMAANCTVVGENPRSVDVAAGETVTVTFELTCSATAGSLEITTATTGPSPDANGYTVLVDGTERGPIGSSNRMLISGLTLGPHGVGLSGLAANCRTDEEAFRSVLVTTGSTTTVAFNVSCVPPPSAVGALKVTTNTSGSDVDPDGYALAVDARANQAIGLGASVLVENLAAGVHTVQLSGNDPNCVIGGANPRTVNVSAGGTAEMSFTITCRTRPPTTGTVHVITSTTGVSPDPDGYSLSADGGAGQAIGVNESITIRDLAAGPHNIGLSGVSANCEIKGDNPRSVTITAGQTTDATFSISCVPPPPSTGTLRVTVATTGPDQDSDGYVFAVDDKANQVIGLNETVSIAELGIGVHTIQLSGLASNCTLSGTNPRTVTVAAGGAVDANFTVTCTATTGTIQVSASTTGNGVLDPDGYTVTLDYVTSAAIETNGTHNFELVSAEWHSIRLDGLANNCYAEDNSQYVNVTAAETVKVDFEVICPEQIRIVLTGGDDPYLGLDSHLTGPTSEGSSFHVYWGDRGSLRSSPFARLLYDGVSRGTTVIDQLVEGTYRFMVQDYYNTYSSPSTALGTSGARVEVYTSQGLVQTFLVPNEPGTLWTVFEIDGGAITSPNITPVNTMSYESP